MYKELNVTIQGVSPLLLHNGRLANPLDPIAREMKKVSGKRVKTDEDYATMAKLEWLGGLYTTDPIDFAVSGGDVTIKGGGKACIPGECIESMLIDGAKTMKLGPQFKAGVISDGNWGIQHDGPATIAKMWEDGRFLDVRKAKIQKASVMRSRPIFHTWRLSFVINYLPATINEAQVMDVLRAAGRMKGLGDYRPKFGRFEVV